MTKEFNIDKIEGSVAEYFEYNQVQGADMAQFKIKGTPFDGVSFSYGHVKPVETEEKLKFDFKVQFFNIPKDLTEAALLGNPSFVNLLGRFLTEQIEIYLASGEKPTDESNK